MPSRGRVGSVLALLLVAIGAAVAANAVGATVAANAAAAVAASVAGTAQAPPKFLGFALGEERRYELGPLEELREGELGTWSIRLRELLGEPPDGIFELSHSWQRGGEPLSQPPLGAVIRIESSGELRVNAYGFPLEVSFETRRHLASYGEEVYSVRYRFVDGAYRKYVATDGREVEHPVAIRSNDGRDLSVPRGVWAFVPAGPDCSVPYPIDVRDVGVDRRRKTAGESLSPRDATPPNVYADNRACSESLFFNPGLISLMLPTLWEDGSGAHEFVLLTPAGPFGMPGVGVSAYGISAGAPDFDSREAMSPRTNSWVETLEYRDRVRVEVGARMRDAWLFTGMRALDEIYVDDDGVVLRVDLARHFWERLGIAGLSIGVDPDALQPRHLHVRLLYPSEY